MYPIFSAIIELAIFKTINSSLHWIVFTPMSGLSRLPVAEYLYNDIEKDKVFAQD